MNKSALAILVLLVVAVSFTKAQNSKYQVPSSLQFADLTLKLTDNLRREIQADVDALTRHPKYLNIKLDRVKLYFPLIERILKEENVPDDFKYLVIQESALIPDAVSTSNAVGFWQFKKESAQEVGLRIDSHLDERMNIVSSTAGAAKYLKSNNFYFDNWLYALLGYYAGRGGAQKLVDKRYFGKKQMELGKSTHWYIKKYLAHKVAFQNAMAHYPDPDYYYYEFKGGANKSLREIAGEFNVDEEQVFSINKWLKKREIPVDKTYTVLIPMQGKQPTMIAKKSDPAPTEKPPVRKYDFDKEDQFPVIDDYDGIASALVKINGKQGVLASAGDDIINLSRLGGLTQDQFREYNDLAAGDKIKAGSTYYFQKKRNKAKTHYHIVLPGETLWSISQKYGLKLKKLKQKNRFAIDESVNLKPGRVLWLRFIRPRHIAVEYSEIPPHLVPKQQKPANIEAKEEQAPSPKIEKPIKTTIIKENKTLIANAHSASNRKEETMNHEAETNPDTNIYPENEEISSFKHSDNNISKQQSTSPAHAPEHVKVEGSMKIGESKTKKEASQSNYHLVKPGETLYAISKAYDVNLTDLMVWNNLNLEDGLKIDQKLWLEAPDRQIQPQLDANSNQVNKKSYIYHKVEAGETLYKVARQYEVTIKQIMEWNNKENFELKVGETLLIKN
ncbi:MAG: LysM peptidoglycan-binding domain-containing protein [Candidatus Cyclobacteriaceae bacterium M3_2C_046]